MSLLLFSLWLDDKFTYDNKFRGPIKKRSCTDLVCLFIFAGFVLGWLFVAFFGMLFLWFCLFITFSCISLIIMHAFDFLICFHLLRFSYPSDQIWQSQTVDIPKWQLRPYLWSRWTRVSDKCFLFKSSKA